jgi:hypothetical protein
MNRRASQLVGDRVSWCPSLPRSKPLAGRTIPGRIGSLTPVSIAYSPNYAVLTGRAGRL